MKRMIMIVLGLALLIPAIAHANGKGSFFPQCRFVNAARVDPIMDFGHKPSMHMHQFFGFRRIHKDTRPADLLRRHVSTSCSTHADRSGYWAPTLIGKGRNVHATSVNAYYVVQNGRVRPIPRDVQLRGTEAKYTCGTGYWIDLDDRTPFSCAGMHTAVGGNSGVFPKIEVSFPSCVLASGKIVYNGSCRYRIPQLQLALRFTNRDSINGLHPSSGRWASMHADAMFGWNRKAFAYQIHRCLDPHRECTAILGA